MPAAAPTLPLASSPPYPPFPILSSPSRYMPNNRTTFQKSAIKVEHTTSICCTPVAGVRSIDMILWGRIVRVGRAEQSREAVTRTGWCGMVGRRRRTVFGDGRLLSGDFRLSLPATTLLLVSHNLLLLLLLLLLPPAPPSVSLVARFVQTLCDVAAMGCSLMSCWLI